MSGFPPTHPPRLHSVLHNDAHTFSCHFLMTKLNNGHAFANDTCAHYSHPWCRSFRSVPFHEPAIEHIDDTPFPFSITSPASHTRASPPSPSAIPLWIGGLFSHFVKPCIPARDAHYGSREGLGGRRRIIKSQHPT